MIVSPCISICKTDPSTGYCYGCGRTDEEKKLWKNESTSNDWKEKNLHEILQFYSQFLFCIGKHGKSMPNLLVDA